MFERLLQVHQIELEKESFSYKKLCRELLKLNLKLMEIEKQSALGLDDGQAVNAKAMPEIEDSEYLSTVVEKYVQEQEKSGNWTEKTKAEFLACLNLLKDYHGDIPVKSIDFKAMREYKEALMCLPANLKKHPQYRGRTIHEILEMDVPEPMSTTTVNKYMNRASSLFKFAVRNGYMTINPAEGMQLKKSKRDDEYRDAFSKDDLEKLFNSKEYIEGEHRSDYCFWMPILGLFTGCRLEELAQLHLDDIKESEGVWVFDINNDGAKKVKTKASLRLVPIHPFILDSLQFLQYVEGLKARGFDRLFPELAQRRDGYGQTASKWFGRYKKRCGIVENGKKKDFHSFRHTFANTLKQIHTVEPVMISELLGHEVDSMTMGRYAKRYSPQVLLEQGIKKLDFDVDMGNLQMSRPTK